jgi:hypothetical protein
VDDVLDLVGVAHVGEPLLAVLAGRVDQQVTGLKPIADGSLRVVGEQRSQMGGRRRRLQRRRARCRRSESSGGNGAD